MKISKVDHVKSGIDQKLSNQRGMLYKQPQKKYEGKQLEEHVRNLNRKAKALYQVFPASGNPKTEKELQIINSFIKNILIRLDSGKTSEEIVGYINTYSVAGQISGDHIQELVDQHLKESLRKYTCVDDKRIYVPDIIVALLKSKFNSETLQYDNSELKILIDFIREDYLKEKQIKQIVHSIENNSTPLRIAEINGQKRLIPANADNPKKSYIFEFLKEYAQSDPKGQESLLQHMRYLILLYLYGSDKITDDYCEEIGAWNFGSIVMDNEQLFSEEASMLIQDRIYVNQQIQEGRQSKDTAKVKKNKSKYRMLGDKIEHSINESVVKHYQEACKAVEEKDIPWIKYISDHVMSVYSSKNRVDLDKLSLPYLAKNTWNTWISFIAMKYVDMGKGVYHFAMSDVDKVGKQDNLIIGQIDPKFADGISSFDYERIKAEDDLHRSMSGYIAFAVNNFSRAICSDEFRKKDKKEDVLTVGLDEIPLDDNVKRKLLQYFGGASNWDDSIMDIIDDKDLAACIKENLYVARNVNFHFAGSEKVQKKQDDILEEIVRKETGDIGKHYRKVFYSNNVAAFYRDEDIIKLMNHLYQKEKPYQAQIPSYNKVISKTYLPDLIFMLLKGKNRTKISDPSIMNMFRGTFYFLLKEIYYNDFLQASNLKELFREGLKNNVKDKKSEKAYQNFMQRFEELENMGMDFGEICQQIMTDYEQQNKQKKKTATAVVSEKDKKIRTLDNDTQKYKHFRTLLYVGLREAFIIYLKDEKNKEWYEFLREPVKREQPEEKEFVNKWKLNQYSDCSELILKDPLAAAWYVAAHFINQAQLNHLIGDIKNYIQFISDIDRRAKSTGNPVSESTEIQIDRYRQILRVLEFAKFFCGQITNVLTDYYEDENDFSTHVGHYVKFEKKNMEPAHALQAFSNSLYACGKEKKKAGFYYDGMNPIVNRNITLAAMYGNKKLLENAMIPVTEQDIRKYYSLMAELDSTLKNGAVCKSEDEQKNLRHFQNLKNRIELVDVLTLSELLNDLVAQLIGWAYIRERDMMYLQLGLHYIKLYFTDSVSEDSYLRTLDLEEGSIADGAVLYQIASLYSFNLPMYVKPNESSVYCKKHANSVGAKFDIFEKKYCNRDGTVIENGLCLFENIKLHGDLAEFRDYLAHFKYFAKLDKSILELYSKVYDSFFSYNIKLKKSVSYVFTNILLSYFINAKLSFSLCGISDYKPSRNKTVQRRSANISVESVQTDYFTYKLRSIVKNKNGVESIENDNRRCEVVNIAARDKEFVDEVCKVIKYNSDK